VRLDGVHRLPALFLLRGIRRAAPAQVTACRVVTLTDPNDIKVLKEAVKNRIKYYKPAKIETNISTIKFFNKKINKVFVEI